MSALPQTDIESLVHLREKIKNKKYSKKDKSSSIESSGRIAVEKNISISSNPFKDIKDVSNSLEQDD